MSELPNGERPHYTWPKYVLAAISLFFLVCILWTVKEVGRMRRAKQEGMDSPVTPPALRQAN